MNKWSISFLLVMVLSCAISATTIHVPSQQPTIQAGINAAVNGDTVLVAPGTYTDTVFVISKSVYIISSKGPDSTSFVWTDWIGDGVQFRSCTAGGISGFAISGIILNKQSLIRCFASTVSIKGNVFYDLQLRDRGAIVLHGGGAVDISRNIFSSIQHPSTVIEVHDPAVANISNNVFDSVVRGISISAINCVVENNIFSRCSIYGIYDSGYSVVERYNCFWANTSNRYGGGPVGPTDITQNPMFANPPARDFNLQESSPCIDAGNPDPSLNDPDGTRNDIGALPFLHTKAPEISSIKIDGTVSPNHLLNHVPIISWSFFDSAGFLPTKFEIAVGTDNDWTYSEKWNPAPFGSSDTEIVYDGAVLNDGQTYYARIRAMDPYKWSAWQSTSFRLNTSPTIPIMQLPVSNSIVGMTPALQVTSWIDPEGDAIRYDFKVYSDSTLSNLAANASGVLQTQNSTAWIVAPALPDNKRYWWLTRAFDGYEYSNWSASRTFWTDGIPESPTAPQIISPSSTDSLSVYNLSPEFRWQTATDPDPFDSVVYKVEISPKSNFSSGFVMDSLTATMLIPPDSLEFAFHYWWRVTARDKMGHTAVSPVNDFWTWTLGDVDNSHNTDIADLSRLIDYLFISFAPISPRRVADLDEDCNVDISDLTRLIDRLFISFRPLGVGCE